MSGGSPSFFLAAWLASGFAVTAPQVPGAPAGASLTAAPVVRWSTRLPGNAPEVATPTEPGAPVVDGDRIFVGYSGANALLVLGRGDGEVIAELAARAPVSCAPIVRNGHVIFSDAAGYTASWTEKAGVWVREWEHYSGAPIVSSPTVIDGVVYLSNVDELVYALDAATGELRWRYQHRLDAARSSALELFGAPAPQVRGDEVYAGFSDGFLVALSRADGSERWTSLVGEGTYPDIISAPLPLDDGAVLVAGYTKPLLHFDPKSRSASWRLDVGAAAAPITAGDTLYHPGSDGKLRRIDARTGALQWTWSSGTTGPLLTPELTAQGVLVASTDSTIFLIDPDTGAERWRLDPGQTLNGFGAPPVVAGDDIYAVSNGGVLYALRGRAAGTVPDRTPWVSPTAR